MQRLMQAAAELIKVEKNDKGQFTKLSELHIKNAAAPIRQMVADIALMGAMHALGGMVRLAAKGLSKLRLECTTCKLEETIAKEEAKQKENVPPQRPRVEVPGTTRGFSIEDQHIPTQGYRSLREAGSVKGIDAIKGGDFETVIEGGQVIRKYIRPDGLSVKSTRVVEPIALRRKIRADLAPLRGRYVHKEGRYWIDGLRQRRLDLIFEEGVSQGFTRETLRVLEAARAEAGNIEFRWFVWIHGTKIPDRVFVRDFGHLITD
jgi:hypothetical protein